MKCMAVSKRDYCWQIHLSAELVLPATSANELPSSHVTSLLFLFIARHINFVALVRGRTIPTERTPIVGEVSANFCGWSVSRDQRNRSPRPHSRISRPEPLLFLPSSSSVLLTRPSGPRLTENLVVPGIEPGTSGSIDRNSDH
jgi:hypothetical protein